MRWEARNSFTRMLAMAFDARRIDTRNRRMRMREPKAIVLVLSVLAGLLCLVSCASFGHHQKVSSDPPGVPAGGGIAPPQRTGLTDPKDIAEFVTGPEFAYSTVKERLRPDIIPVLHKMLSDRAYLDTWSKLATALAYLGGNADSSKVILDYVCRFDDWKDLDEERGRPLLLGKTFSLRLLGLLKEKDNEEILRRAATEDAYARSLINPWISRPIPAWWRDGPQWFVVSLRSAAMDGLVLSGFQENIEYVRCSHKTLVARLSRAIKAEPTRNFSSDLWFYQESVGAVVRAELLEEFGYSKYLDHESDDEWLTRAGSFSFGRILGEDGIFDIGGPR